MPHLSQQPSAVRNNASDVSARHAVWSGGTYVVADIENTLSILANDLGADTVVEIVDLWITDAPANLRSMREGLANGDTTLLRRSSHSLKSTAATVGAHDLSKLCFDVEQAAREGRPADAAPMIDPIQQSMNATLGVLQAFRPKLVALMEG